MPRKNLYLQSEAISDHVNLGLAAALEELESSSASALWIVSSTMAQLKHSDLSQALGEPSALVLAKGGALNHKGKPVRYYTEITLPRSAPKVIVLLVHPTAKLMTKVDALAVVTALFVVPWNMEEVQAWIDSHGPTDLLTSSPAATISVSDPTVVAALKSLMGSINRSTGITHPLDKARTIDTFRALAKAHVSVNANEVRAWLVQQGMKASYADDIAAIAANPSKFQRAGSSSLRTDIVKLWKGEITS